jgi:hypothetical protein
MRRSRLSAPSAARRATISRLLNGPNSLLAGKNAGKFRRFSRFQQQSVSKTYANSAVCERIPCAGEQGFFSRTQGINSAFSIE